MTQEPPTDMPNPLRPLTDAEAAVRRYTQWLMIHNTLVDFGRARGRGRPTNGTLEALRNNAPGVDALPQRRPTVRQMHEHVTQKGASTLFVSNSEEQDVLLMLADLDNKDGRGDSVAAANYLRDRYFDKQAVIEPSTGGKGRHLFFLLNVRGRPRSTVPAAIERYVALARTDPAWGDMGVEFDRILGLPTLWHADASGAWRIKRRGCAMRLPYLINLELRPFEDLRAFDLAWFEERAERADTGRVHSSSPVMNIGVTPGSAGERGLGVTRAAEGRSSIPGRGPEPSSDTSECEAWSDVDHPDGRQRRLACAQKMMRLTRGCCTPQECLDAYLTHYTYTGDGPRDVEERLRDFTRLIHKLSQTFRPLSAATTDPGAKPFRPGEYTEIVEQLVAPDAFAWNRREILNAKRLADFVGIKLQEAFALGTDDRWFGRASRAATIRRFRTLKKMGSVDWALTTHHYTRLLEIAVKYSLLCIFEDFRAPDQAKGGMRNGTTSWPRLIGPGPALPNEYERFTGLYQAWRVKPEHRIAA